MAQTAVITLVTVAALVLLALVAVYWTWQWLAPRPEPRAQIAANAGSQVASANNLFGAVEQSRSSEPPTNIAIRLLGTVATKTGRHGYAVLRLDTGRTLSVREGEDIAPGIRLAEVATDHVILERGAVRETLAWPEKKTSVESVTPRIGR